MLAGRPVLPWVKVPVPKPSDSELPVGLAERPHTVPRAVTAAPPPRATVPPRVAVVSAIVETVGADTAARVVKVLSEYNFNTVDHFRWFL